MINMRSLATKHSEKQRDRTINNQKYPTTTKKKGGIQIEPRVFPSVFETFWPSDPDQVLLLDVAPVFDISKQARQILETHTPRHHKSVYHEWLP